MWVEERRSASFTIVRQNTNICTHTTHRQSVSQSVSWLKVFRQYARARAYTLISIQIVIACSRNSAETEANMCHLGRRLQFTPNVARRKSSHQFHNNLNDKSKTPGYFVLLGMKNRFRHKTHFPSWRKSECVIRHRTNVDCPIFNDVRFSNLLANFN